MFPETHDLPPRLAEAPIRVSVAPRVRRKLCSPPWCVGSQTASMLTATVPEASIDENSELCSREHDVRTSAEVRQWPCVNAIAQAALVEQGPQRELLRRIPTSNLLHALADGGGRRKGSDASTGRQRRRRMD